MPRAPFTAASSASVPELQKRVCASAGLRAASISASAISASVGRPKAVPRAIASVSAATTGGKAWPWIREKKLFAQSRMRRPSMSRIQQPSPRAA